jgi:hypothetical protein
MTAGTELIPVDNIEALERLDPASREIAVTHMLDNARGWLAHALEGTAPREMAEFKAFVATLAETSRQLQLSKEIQLDAQEMVRRAERGVGLAIRKGQEDGTVRRPYFTIRRPGHDVGNPDIMGPAEATGIPITDLSGNIYPLTDNVSDEEFEEALDEAKDEGNLSRANVVRKAKKEAPKPATRPDVLKGRRHLDPVRVISNTVSALEGTRIVLGLLEPHHYAQLNADEAAAWSSSLTESIRSLNHLNKQLKELNQA